MRVFRLDRVVAAGGDSKGSGAAAAGAGGGDAKSAAGTGEAASAQSLALSVTPPPLYASVRVWSDAQDDETMACVVEMPDVFGDALLNVSLKTQIPQPSLKLYYFLNPAEAGTRVKVDGQAAYWAFVDYLRTIRTSLLFAYDARRPFASATTSVSVPVPAPAHSTASHPAAGAARPVQEQGLWTPKRRPVPPWPHPIRLRCVVCRRR